MRDGQHTMKADHAPAGRWHGSVRLRALLSAALLATALVTALAGCGGGSNKSSPPSEEPSPPPPETSQWDTMVWDQGQWG